MKNVVIVGGGFGGIYVAKYLLRHFRNSKDVRVTLVSNNNYFLFTPMIHEVATGGLNRFNVVEPIRDILKGDNFDFYKASADKIDFKKRIVLTSLGNIGYDYLVIAIGATTDYYNVPGAAQYSLPLKTIKDAATIRDRIISCFELASKKKDVSEKRKLLNFIVVGGGPTGVELAGEITEFAKQIKNSDYKSIGCNDICVSLIQRGKDIIPMAHERCRQDAANALERKGVRIFLNSSATEVGSNYVKINNKDKIYSNCIVWASGVKPCPIETTPKISDERNFFHVDSSLQVKNLKKVYAIGDVSLAFNPGSQKPVPMLAQVATDQARCVAKNIIADISGKKKGAYRFRQAGFLVSVGQKFAVAEVFGIRFKGFFAWWLWRTIYLFKLVGFGNKFRVAYDWTLNLFFRRDTSEL